MAKRNIKITIKLPAGVVATKELSDLAKQAAEAAIESTVAELAEAQKLASELAEKGYNITAEEILTRRSAKPAKRTAKKAPKAKKKAKKTASKKKANGTRKRIVLNEDQRAELSNDLAGGMKIAEASAKYGISTATVMNHKKAAGLIKSR